MAFPILLGGAALVVTLLSRKRRDPATDPARAELDAELVKLAEQREAPAAPAHPEPTPAPSPDRPAPSPSLPVPSGWRRLKPSELAAMSSSDRSYLYSKAAEIVSSHHAAPLGTLVPFTYNGVAYAGRVEEHYDERRGTHRGVSLFVRALAVSGRAAGWR
jgi:hypothetical protein